MKQIWSIARTELQCLFYSPVAWILLCIFMAQAATFFLDPLYACIRHQLMDWTSWGITRQLFAGGLYGVREYLYLYVPLLTMGLLSKEKSSGSIKLLYSTPISGGQIVLGKFVSMMAYGAILCGMLLLFILFAGLYVEHLDYPMALCGLAGIFLLFCAYAAIGIFVSSLFVNQTAVAITTFAVLSLLNYAGKVGQDISLVRDITYWICLTNRTGNGIAGLVSSVDVIYFVLIISLFLYWATLKIRYERLHVTKFQKVAAYMLPAVVTVVIGVISTRPSLIGYRDMTANEANTLTQTSREVVAQLKGGLTVTTYVNLLDPQFSNKYAMPDKTMDDRRRLEQYVRFKPEIKQKYEYYYADVPGTFDPEDSVTTEQRARKAAEAAGISFSFFKPASAYAEEVDLGFNDYRLCRKIERENGRSTILYFYNDLMQEPSEAEITGAMLKLCDNQPLTAFLTGHGERSFQGRERKSWRPAVSEPGNRFALTNQGMRVASVTAEKGLPSDLQTLVIADLQAPLTEKELENIRAYVAAGGNLLIAAEPGRQELYAPLLSDWGITLKEGMLVQATEEYTPDLVTATLSTDGAGLVPGMAGLLSGTLTMPGAAPLAYEAKEGYKVTELCKASGNYGMQTGTVNLLDKTSLMRGAQTAEEWCTMLALTRPVSEGKEQRIVIAGDADWLSVKEMATARGNMQVANSFLARCLFNWLSDGYFPRDYSRPKPKDNYLDYPYEHYKLLRNVLLFVLPLLVLSGGLAVCMMRRRK